MKRSPSRLALIAAIVAFQVGPVLAQMQPNTQTAPLAVGPATANVAIGGAGTTLWLLNDGGVEAFWNIGIGNGTQATTSNYPIPPGICETVLMADTQGEFIAAITNGGLTTLRVMRGNGGPLASCGVGGGSGTAGAAGYPAGSTPEQGIGTGTTGAVTGTLAASANKTTYICQFDVQATGTGAVGPITITGLIGGARTYQATAPNATGLPVAFGNFTPCIPASAVNTPIVITTTADATASAVDVNSSGFQQ